MRRLAKIPCEVCGEPSTNRAVGVSDGRRFDFGVCADHHAEVPRLLLEASGRNRTVLPFTTEADAPDKPWAILVRTHAQPSLTQIWDRYYCREDGEDYLADARDDPDVKTVVGLRRA